MTRHCRPGIPLLCLMLAAVSGCAGPRTRRAKAPNAEMEKVLAQGAPQFQDCGRLLPRPKTNKELAVEMTFRLAPSGELEGLWLEPKTPGDQAFYDCVFHVVEKMAFPPTHDRSSTEVQQRLVFRVKPARKGP